MFAIIAKLFSVLLAAVAISKSYVDLRAKREPLSMFLFWILTWIGIVTVALRPSLVDLLIVRFGGGRAGIGTFFGMGLVFLYFVVYRIYIKIERIEEKLTVIVQEMALRDGGRSKGSSSDDRR